MSGAVLGELCSRALGAWKWRWRLDGATGGGIWSPSMQKRLTGLGVWEIY